MNISSILSVVFLLILLGYLARRLFFKSVDCKNQSRLDGKVAIVTGANSGVGYETALELAKRGVKLVMACVDLKQAELAARKIRRRSLNDNVRIEYIDLGNLSSVREFAAKMNKNLQRLDILVNNAAVMMCPHWKTKDGFEMQFGVNYLGHFLLTNLLLDLIKRTPSSRVISVSSVAHAGGVIEWDNLNSEKSYSPIRAYNNSKLAVLLFASELARRLQNTQTASVSLHPGVVRTKIMRHTSSGIGISLDFLVQIFFPLWYLISISPRDGAQTSIHCAVDDQVFKYNGAYFSDCKPKQPSAKARDAETARKLWEISAEMVGLEVEASS